MKIQLGCYECVMTMVIRLARQMSGDPARQRELADELLGIFAERKKEFSPPELAWEYYKIFRRETGVADPFLEEKRRSTELGLKLLDEMRSHVEASSDPFQAALRLAVGGNIIDFGATPDFDIADAKKRILEVLDQPCDEQTVADLHRRMDRAKNIVYVLDNCGEAVLDRLLIERFPGRITVAARGGAIFNDVTREDVAASGITAPVIDSGVALPGVSLKCSAPDFVEALRRADLVVAKGQGNFESLEGEFDRPVYFLLRVKCAVISGLLGAPQGSLQVIGRNLD